MRQFPLCRFACTRIFCLSPLLCLWLPSLKKCHAWCVVVDPKQSDFEWRLSQIIPSIPFRLCGADYPLLRDITRKEILCHGRITICEKSACQSVEKTAYKKGRDQTGTYLIEGAHLIEEALKTDELIELMIEHNQPIPEYVKEADIPITFISPEICHVISGTETPQGMFALCKKVGEA